MPRYDVALALVAAASALCCALQPLLRNSLLAFFLTAVVASALHGATPAGMVAPAAKPPLASHRLVEPRSGLIPDPP